MQSHWTSDVHLSLELARECITRQFPDLAPFNLALMGEGWDNAAFLVNDEFVFRFPRRQIAAALIQREARFLPLLAGLLPQPIPAPLFVGSAGAAYPYPFAGYRLIPGTTACRPPLPEADRGRNAVPLAEFLHALHNIPIDAATLREAPIDDIERANLRMRAPRTLERLREIAEKRPGWDAMPWLEAVERLKETPVYSGPPCWVHGDLYPRHLLLDDIHRLCGVIDWGDIHVGDPALDLSIAFTFLPPFAREHFRQAYGGIDAATWDRARFRAISYAAILIPYGEDVGDENIRAVGEYALQTALL